MSSALTKITFGSILCGMDVNYITKSIKIVGLKSLADSCQVSYQAVRKWEKVGLPRTEWTGETNYSGIIEKVTNSLVTRLELLSSRCQVVFLGSKKSVVCPEESHQTLIKEMTN